VRLKESLLDTIDAWRRRQDDLPTRPEAIRRLIEQALQAPEGRTRKK
jgi:metal-responsive CopG/Arc/MetJ family transcriptional regulator